MSEIDNPERPVLKPSRAKWRNGLLAGVSILVCLALAYDYFVISSMKEEVLQDTPQQEVQEDIPQEDLQEAIAEADRLDPGWRLSQLEERRAAIRDGQNSALVIMAARSLLPDGWPSWPYHRVGANQNPPNDDVQISDEMLWSLEAPVQLYRGQTKALREVLGRAEKALAAARTVVRFPRGRCPPEEISWLLPFRGGIPDLLAYDVLLRAQDKDVDGALTSCHAMINCGRSIGDEPTLFFQLIREDVYWMVTKMLERTLAQGEPSEASLSSIQHELEEEAEVPLLLIAARGRTR